MKYPKIVLVLSLCGVLLFSACKNNDKSSSKDAIEKEAGNKEAAEKQADNKADTRAISDIMNTYNQHFVKAEFDSMTAYIYPEIFKEFPKEEMIASMRKSLHSPEFDIEIIGVQIHSISPIYVSKEGNGKYAVVVHKANAKYQFKPDQKEETLRNYCIIYTSNFGDENVECNIAGKNFNIMMEDVSFFIYSDAAKKWYTLGTSSPEDLEKYIPADVRKQMGVKN
jgi:hypothetical protein